MFQCYLQWKLMYTLYTKLRKSQKSQEQMSWVLEARIRSAAAVSGCPGTTAGDGFWMRPHDPRTNQQPSAHPIRACKDLKTQTKKTQPPKQIMARAITWSFCYYTEWNKISASDDCTLTKQRFNHGFEEFIWSVHIQISVTKQQQGSSNEASTEAYWYSWHWQSCVTVEQQGCSQGFHIRFAGLNWFSTGFSERWCIFTASFIVARTKWKAGSVSGVSGVLSDGSFERSKSRGGSWKVT